MSVIAYGFQYKLKVVNVVFANLSFEFLILLEVEALNLISKTLIFIFQESHEINQIKKHSNYLI